MTPERKISIIVAVAEENAIGYRNDLLCHLPSDLKYFKKVTSGKTVIMGKNTWISLPRKPLPNRRNIVITDLAGEKFDGAESAYSIQGAVDMCAPGEDCFVIGGGSIYRQFLPYADLLYITHVHHKFEADTFFEPIDPEIWELESLEPHSSDAENPYDYSFAVYKRK